MYYKVMKDNKVIDVLDCLTYLKWQPKHKIWILSDENEAQAILLSNKNTIVHEKSLYNIPAEVVDKYDTVSVVEIDQFEYKQLRMLNGKSLNEILDEYTLLLIQEGII